MASTQRHIHYVQQLQSPNPVEVYDALRAIKNTIIGSSTKKTLYCNLQLIPIVISLLALDDTDVQIRVQATTIISSLAHKNEEVAQILLSGGVIAPLINQIAPGSDAVLMEVSERALNAILSYTSTKMNAEEHIGTMIPYLLSIITEDKDLGKTYSMRAHARIELGVLILSKLCVTEARQYTIANEGAIDLLVPLLSRGYPKLQIATLRALSSLSYENVEICNVLATITPNDGEKLFSETLLELARNCNSEIRLHACLCLANLSRMRVNSGSLKDVQTVAVPALVKLMDHNEMDKLQVIQALGYLCHEDVDMQAAAKNAGAISDLLKILSTIESEENADFVDQQRNTQIAKTIFLTLGTIISTDEECRRKAVESSIFHHLVRAMNSKDSGIKAAACLCARYITRSISICRTHLPESGILKPITKLLSDQSEDVRVTASATLINLLTDFSPLRQDALKDGVMDIIAQLLEAENATLRRNALWSLKNILAGSDDDIRRNVLSKISITDIYDLACGKNETMIQEQAANVLRNIVTDSQFGIDSLYNAIGEDNMLRLMEQLVLSDNEQVVIHGLYLINNISIRSQKLCDCIVKDDAIMQCIAGYIVHSSSEVAIASLWCISSIASHKHPAGIASSAGEVTPMYITKLNALRIQPTLDRMARDTNVPLEVRDRVKSCLDIFDYERSRGEPMDV